MNIYVYIYIHIHKYIPIYIYVYIYGLAPQGLVPIVFPRQRLASAALSNLTRPYNEPPANLSRRLCIQKLARRPNGRSSERWAKQSALRGVCQQA